MNQGIGTIIYPVKDLAQAKALFGALLGVAPVVDQPFYVQYNVGGQNIGLDPNGFNHGMTGPLGYYHVGDIRATLAALLKAGATTQQDVTDVGGGTLIAVVKDASGNTIGLRQLP